MITEAEIEAMRNDPEMLKGIKIGMHDYHLGHMFSSRLVFASLKGTGKFPQRLFWHLVVLLKEWWWLVKTPYQSFAHRHCVHCKEFKAWQHQNKTV